LDVSYSILIYIPFKISTLVLVVFEPTVLLIVGHNDQKGHLLMGMISNVFKYELSINTMSHSGMKIDDVTEIKRV
jgi:hypothetical protein